MVSNSGPYVPLTRVLPFGHQYPTPFWLEVLVVLADKFLRFGNGFLEHISRDSETR